MVAADQLIGIGLTVEADDFTACWEFWFCDEVKRKHWDAVAFEALDPIIGPPFTVFAHGVGEEGLFGSELGAIHGSLMFFDEAFENVLALAALVAKDGGVADVGLLAKECFSPGQPVVDDAVAAWFVVKKCV